MDTKSIPAFPASYYTDDGEWAKRDGMTLRDYFAAKVLQGIYANPDRGGTCIDAAARAYEAADAMIAARSRPVFL